MVGRRARRGVALGVRRRDRRAVGQGVEVAGHALTPMFAILFASQTPIQSDTTGPNRRTKRRARSAASRFAERDLACLSERRLPESNRCKRLCRPLRNHSAKAPGRASLAAAGRPRASMPRCRVAAWPRSSSSGRAGSPTARRFRRAIGPAPALCLHGFPESSYMWRIRARRRSPRRGGARSRPTSPATATRRPTRPAPGSATSRRSSGSAASSGSTAWRSSSTTGAG